MEKLIIEKNKEDYYILEINDNGDTIEFDLTDITLPERIMNAGEEIIKIGKKYTEKEKELIKKYGKNAKDLSKKDEENLSKEYMSLVKEHGKEMRKQFDSFLGEGTCYKIFGDKESIDQYNRLMNGLQPHFEKMHIQKEKAQQKLVDKYLDKKSEVI